MSQLKETLGKKIAAHSVRTQRLLKEFGNVVIDKVNIGQVIGGMRDIKALVTDISYLDPMRELDSAEKQSLRLLQLFQRQKDQNIQLSKLSGISFLQVMYLQNSR